MPVRSFPLARLLPIATAALVAGCASGAGTAAGPGTAENFRSDNGVDMDLYREAASASQPLIAPVERVWPHVAEVYAELGIPVTGADPSAMVVVAARQRLRTVGGRGIAAYFDCGGGFGNAAASYQVMVTARTELVPDGAGGTVARTSVEAGAHAPASGTRVRCISKGVLERVIGERLAARTAAAG